MVSLVDGALPLHHPSAAIDATVDAKVIAQTWLDQFASATSSNDVPATLTTIWKDGFWYVSLCFVYFSPRTCLRSRF